MHVTHEKGNMVDSHKHMMEQRLMDQQMNKAEERIYGEHIKSNIESFNEREANKKR